MNTLIKPSLKESSINLFINSITDNIDSVMITPTYTDHQKVIFSLLIKEGQICIATADYIKLREVAYKIKYANVYLKNFV